MEPSESIATLVRDQRFAEAADRRANSPEECFLRARARMHLGREREARADLEQCLDAFGDRAAIELAFLDIRERGDLEAAHRTAQRVVASAPQGSGQRARALHILGLAEGKRRRSAPAIDALLEAVDAYGSRGERLEQAQARDTLGSVFAAQGRLDLAASAYALSIVAKIRGGDRYGAALTLGNLGRLHLRAGRTRDAIDCLQQDLELATELEDARGRARVHEDLGRAWMDAGEADKARDQLDAALSLGLEHGYRDLEFFARKDLALLHSRAGRHAEAEAEIERARAARPGGEAYLETVLRAAEGECRLARGDRRALDLVAHAAEEFARLDLPDLEIEARIALAEACLQRGRWEAAEDGLRRAAARARMDGYARYLPRLREVMTRLRIVPGLEREDGGNGPSLPRGGLADSGASDAVLRAGYVLLERVGAGGYGEVWRAYDPELGHMVAIKTMVLDRIYAPEARLLREESLHRELEAAARIRHPGIVRVFAVGTDANDRMYVVQEYVRGRPLQERMPKRPTADVIEAVEILTCMAGALEELHAQGVVHRDLKPANVIVREESGLPVLIDFGFALIADLERDWERGRLIGTLAYMAPEQAAGEPLEGRSDAFALGVIAYEWLTGTRPFRLRAKNFHELAAELRQSSPARMTDYRPGLPQPLVHLIHGLLEPRLQDRPTAGEARGRLDQLLSGLRSAEKKGDLS